MTDRQTNLSGVWGPRLGRGGPNRGGLAVSASLPYSQKIINLFGSSIVAYWPMSEASGTVSTDIGGRGHNGAYTGVTLAQTGIGDERTSASFDGSTSYNNVYSAGLNTDFNNAQGTIATWGKVSGSGVWTDATQRMGVYLAADGNNEVYVSRDAVNNGLRITYRANAVSTNVIAVSGALLGWMHLVATWNVTANQFIAYLNGVQFGTTQTCPSGWVGALNSTKCNIGSLNTTPTQPWSGLLAHALLLNRAATAAEVLAMATLLS